MAGFWEALGFGRTPEQEQEILQGANTPIDFGAMPGVAGDAAMDVLTNPGTYLEAAALLPGSGMKSSAFPGVNSVRNAKPNWNYGGGGKPYAGSNQTRQWTWGADGPPTTGPGTGVRRVSQPGNTLPATQGGLPAVQSGANLPVVRGNTLPATIAAPTGAAAGAGNVMPNWLKALTGATAAYTGYGILDGEQPPVEEPGQMPYVPQSGGSADNGLDIASILAMVRRDGGIRGVDFDTLPQVDYENAPQVDRQGYLDKVAASAPEAPDERSWIQGLGDWVIPALAGGILGGLPGIVLGGLMGEGNRQTDEQGREKAYQTAMNEFDIALAEAGLNLEEAERKEFLDTAIAQRQQEEGNYRFERGQKDDAMRESNFLDQQTQTDLGNVSSAFGIADTAQRMEYRDQLMQQPVQSDPQQVFTQLINTAPGVYQMLQNDPAFQKYQMAVRMNDDITAQITMADMMMGLSQDPQYGPIVQQIQQQMANQQRMQMLQ